MPIAGNGLGRCNQAHLSSRLGPGQLCLQRAFCKFHLLRRYEDNGIVRPIVHRASLVEMAVPYADTHAPFHRKCAFDVGDCKSRSLLLNPLSSCHCYCAAQPSSIGLK